MSVNDRFISEYRFTTRLLADPYDVLNDRNWGGKLSEEEFFNVDSGFFLDPINECSDDTLKEHISGFVEELVNIRRTLKLSYIVGSPGCGKTTFLHYVLRRRKDDEVPLKGIVFDMFASVGLPLRFCQRNISGSDIGLDSLSEETTRYKFISVLLEKVNEVLDYNHTSYYINNDIDGYKEHIDLIVQRYSSRFARNCSSHLTRVFTPFFMALMDFVVKVKSIYDIDEQNDALVKELLQGYRDDSRGTNDPYYAFSRHILCLLTILKICEVDDESFVARQYKYIYAVDNIEYFINQDAVFDKDISDIERIMNSFNLYFRQELDDVHAFKNTRSPFLGHFKTVLVLRDSTNFLEGFRPGNAQEDDIQEEVYNKIELTKMFSLEAIIKKRVGKLKERGLLTPDESEICDVICDVVSDETYTDNSSKRALESMYNHNKRRTIIYLNKIFKDKDVRQEYRRLQECCKYFKETEITTTYIKHGYRSFVIRKLLDLVAKTNYFQEIIAVRTGRTGAGYARRILTVLQNYSKDHSNYCSFRTIADSLEYITNNEKDALQKAAQVLSKMNDSGRATTNWCQLVIINIEQKNITENNLYNALTNRISENDLYGVKITEAGKTLLRLMSRFEYFTCRYYPEFNPLFDKDNLVLDDSAENKKCFKAEKLIEKVVENCLKCLRHMKDKDDRFERIDDEPQYKELHETFDYEIGVNYHSHAYHIVQRNIGDLEAYRCYLMSCNEKNILVNPSKLEKDVFDKCLKSLLDQIMDSIKELLDCLYNELHNYRDREGNSYLLPTNKTSQFFDDIRSKFESARMEMSNNKYVPIVIEKNTLGKN